MEKTRNSIVGNIESLFGAYSEVDDDFYEELEEALILSDLGMETTTRIVESLRKKAREQRLKKPEEVRELLVEEISGILKTSEPGITEPGKMNVILVIGVNGVGKTTSIGKIAAQLKSDGNQSPAGGRRHVPGRRH